MIMPRARDKMSFFVGLILFAMGGIPLANKLGFLGFNLPELISGAIGSVAIWIIAVGGAYVLIDGIIEPKTHSLHWTLVLIGLLLLVTGLIPILNNFGVLPFGFGFLNNLVVYNSIITLEGLLLVIGGLTEH